MMNWYPLAATLLLLAPAPAAARSVVTAERYLDVTTGRYVEHPAIFIGDDGRITGIADARTARWDSQTTHINLAGQTLVPGLIDMHVHLDSPADIGGYRGLEFTDSFWAMTAVASAKDMLDAGFTTVRNVGSGNRNDVGLKQAIENGYAVGPRIVPSGHALGATGGHCDSTFLPPSLEKAEKEEGIGDSPDELRYRWHFGDGTKDRNGKTLTKLYKRPGVYDAEVTVTRIPDPTAGEGWEHLVADIALAGDRDDD